MLLKLAIRSLSRQRRRTALTMGAIAIGTAVVIFAWGFGEGIVGWMTHTAQNARLGAMQVHAAGYFDVVDADPMRSTFAVDTDLRAGIASVDGVRGVSERLHLTGLLTTGSRSAMVMVDALDPVAEPTVCPERLSGITGGAQTLARPRAIVLGRELAKSLGVGVGASVTLQASTITGAQNALDFMVVDVTAGAAFLESKRLVTINIADGRELTSAEGKVVELAVGVTDDVDSDADVDDVARRVSAALKTDGALEVHTWRELSPFMRDSVARIRVVLRGVSVVLFVVVVFGVANTMLMSIYERVREIGTMLALGMTRQRILELFLLEASILAGVGAGAGAVVGSAVVLALAQQGIDFTPPGAGSAAVIVPVWSPAVVVVVVVAAVVGAVAATVAPARRVSRLPPTEALRAP
jgi:putative ABC transport system permease protein